MNDFLTRAAEQSGFIRERYADKDAPTNASMTLAVPVLGELRHQMILSSFLFHRMKKERWRSRYVIACGYPGQGYLYPQADEYWAIKNPQEAGLVFDTADKFKITDNRMVTWERQLNRFMEVIPTETWDKYYTQGFTTAFFDEFKWLEADWAAVPSPSTDFNRAAANRVGFKVVVPTVRRMRHGKGIVKVQPKFWQDLLQKMLKAHIVPVIPHGCLYEDVSPYFGADCLYVGGSAGELIATMRSAGMVLDVFNGSSSWAILARTPFVACVERHYWAEEKLHELTDLCCSQIPSSYLFNFPTIIEGGDWFSVTDHIVHRLGDFLPSLNRDTWPPTNPTSVTIPYTLVRKRKAKRLGMRFIKVNEQ